MRSPLRARLCFNEFEGRFTPSAVYDNPESEKYQVAYSNYNAAIQPVIAFEGMVGPNAEGKILRGMKIHVKVVAADGTLYEETFEVTRDMTPKEIADMIANNMKKDGWDVDVINGTIALNGHNKDGVVSPVKRIGVESPTQDDKYQPTIGGVIRDVEIIKFDK